MEILLEVMIVVPPSPFPPKKKVCKNKTTGMVEKRTEDSKKSEFRVRKVKKYSKYGKSVFYKHIMFVLLTILDVTDTQFSQVHTLKKKTWYVQQCPDNDPGKLVWSFRNTEKKPCDNIART